MIKEPTYQYNIANFIIASILSSIQTILVQSLLRMIDLIITNIYKGISVADSSIKIKIIQSMMALYPAYIWFLTVSIYVHLLDRISKELEVRKHKRNLAYNGQSPHTTIQLIEKHFKLQNMIIQSFCSIMYSYTIFDRCEKGYHTKNL
jgi:hypothetical protein